MEQKKWKEALPYANAAGETWAEWAMFCASECNEGLKDWKAAEQWMQRVSERYSPSACEWYLWCRRTGHGDATAAAKLALETFEPAGDQLPDRQKVHLSLVYFLEKRFDKALDLLTSVVKSRSNDW